MRKSAFFMEMDTMIHFCSGNTRAVNSARAVEENFDAAFPDGMRSDIRIIIFQASAGHKLDRLGDAIRERAGAGGRRPGGRADGRRS